MQAEAGTTLSIPPSPEDTERPERRTRRPILLLAVIAVVGYAADQLTKAWAASSLDPMRPKDLVGSLLRLHLTRNAGAAFSLATNATWVLTIIASVVIITTIVVARRLRSRPWACALGLLIGGALGNLTDRFFRYPGGGRGHVVDFLELPHWPIFNVADMCVVAAACLIALLAMLGIGVDGTRQQIASKDDGEDHADDDEDGSDHGDDHDRTDHE